MYGQVAVVVSYMGGFDADKHDSRGTSGTFKLVEQVAQGGGSMGMC